MKICRKKTINLQRILKSCCLWICQTILFFFSKKFCSKNSWIWNDFNAEKMETYFPRNKAEIMLYKCWNIWLHKMTRNKLNISPLLHHKSLNVSTLHLKHSLNVLLQSFNMKKVSTIKLVLNKFPLCRVNFIIIIINHLSILKIHNTLK